MGFPEIGRPNIDSQESFGFSVSWWLNPVRLFFFVFNTIPKKEDIRLLYIAYHNILNKILLYASNLNHKTQTSGPQNQKGVGIRLIILYVIGGGGEEGP